MRGLDIRGVLEFMSEMTLVTGYPVPAPRGFASEWSRGLELGRRGTGRLLFTGALYQLVPYIEASVALISRLEAAGKGWALRYGGLLSKSLGQALSGLVRPDRGAIDEYNGIVRSIALLLLRSDVEFDYVPEVSDMYSGALLYDYGVTDALIKHWGRVKGALESLGVDEVITVDPHSTETLLAMRRALGLSVEVRTYLDLVRPGQAGGPVELAIHDSCIYARSLGLSGKVRELLRAAGFKVIEPRRSGTSTSCCGGPIEALSPGMASSVARSRLAELASASRIVITACPICRANLSRVNSAGVRIVDLAQVLQGS